MRARTCRVPSSPKSTCNFRSSDLGTASAAVMRPARMSTFMKSSKVQVLAWSMSLPMVQFSKRQGQSFAQLGGLGMRLDCDRGDGTADVGLPERRPAEAGVLGLRDETHQLDFVLDRQPPKVVRVLEPLGIALRMVGRELPQSVLGLHPLVPGRDVPTGHHVELVTHLDGGHGFPQLAFSRAV